MISSSEGQADMPVSSRSSGHIPLILHYIYLSGYDAYLEETKKPGAKTLKWQYDSCVEAHPHWEVMFWTQAMADELLEQHYPWFLPVWHAYEREVSGSHEEAMIWVSLDYDEVAKGFRTAHLHAMPLHEEEKDCYENLCKFATAFPQVLQRDQQQTSRQRLSKGCVISLQ